MLQYINAFKEPILREYIDIFYGSQRIGKTHKNHIQSILTINIGLNIFIYKETALHFSPTFINTPLMGKNRMIELFCINLRSKGLIPNWRNELYGVHHTHLSSPLLFVIERGAISFFGFRAYGTHINGYTKKDDTIKIWLSQRSIYKKIAPLKLDQIVAGGLTFNNSIEKNAIRECHEEANITQKISQNIRYLGSLNYQREENHRIRHDELFFFDLELPLSFTPQNNDREVEKFILSSPNRIVYLLEQDDLFKKNSALILINFLLRHKLINRENNPNYKLVKKSLHHMVKAPYNSL